MTNLIGDFCFELMLMRKDRNRLVKAMQLAFAETTKIEKSNSPRKATDADLIKVLKNTIAGLKEVIGHSHRDTSYEHDQVELFKKYLPHLMTEDQLEGVIFAIMEANDLTTSGAGMKDMGVVMKELKRLHPGEYDGKQASQKFKQIIS